MAVAAPPMQSGCKSAFFRPDIEGLRAVAVLLVVAAHYGVPGFSGGFIGVDIFFVISGFLITGVLVREREDTGGVRFGRFYANRLRRLLPALATMVLGTTFAAHHLLPISEQVAHSAAAAASMFWVSNIYFAFADIDYFAAGNAGNAFLHTWSLGVEEQFYLLWPLLVWAAWMQTEAPGRSGRALRIFAGISAVSLLGCLTLAHAYPILAYYSMPTRAWQFAAGASAWLLVRAIPPQRIQARVSAWAGGLAIVVGLLLVGPGQTYPSTFALLPTLGTCALLWAGASAAKPQLSTALGTSPMQALGALSYAWYLWHWPVLIIGQLLLPMHGHPGNMLWALTISLLAAYLTQRCIENPIRYGRLAQWQHARQIVVALCLMALVTGPLLYWRGAAQTQLARTENPLYASAAFDLPVLYQYGCDDWYHSDTLNPCSFGSKDAPNTAVLLGDSIGAQWFPALSAMLDPRDWKIIVLTKSSCPMVDEPFFYQRIGREYTECATWRNRAIVWLSQRHVQRIFIGQTASSDFSAAQWTDGTRRILDRLAPHADALYVIQANPTLPFNGLDCLRTHAPDACQSPAADARHQRVETALRQAMAQQPKAHWLETASFVCPQGICRALQTRANGSDVVVFRDSQHLTASFVATAANHFFRQIDHAERTSGN